MLTIPLISAKCEKVFSSNTLNKSTITIMVGLSLPTVRELDRARTAKSKVRVWSLNFNPIHSIGQLLSIIVGRNISLEGIVLKKQ